MVKCLDEDGKGGLVLTHLSDNHRLRVLRRVELFTDLDEAELQVLGAEFSDQMLPGRTHVYHHGDPSDSFFVISSGSVSIYRDEVGKPVQLQARFGPGDFFGEMGLFDGFRRSASARTSDLCHLLVVSKQRLLAFLDKHPDVLMKLQIAAARRHTLNVAAALDLGMRHEVRIRLDREVTVETVYGEQLPMRLENLSLGGLCLRGAPATWAKGRALRFTILFGEARLDVVGQVSWREPETLGLAFVDSSPDHDAMVQSLLRRLLA